MGKDNVVPYPTIVFVSFSKIATYTYLEPTSNLPRTYLDEAYLAPLRYFSRYIV